MQGIHALGTTVVRAGTGADSFKGALYFTNGSLGASTTVYNSVGEVTGTGYSAGGVAVTNGTAPALGGSTAYWTPSAAVSIGGLTISSQFDTLLIYNSSQGNRAVAVLTFPPQTVSSGTFTYNFPSNGPTTALLQFT